MFSKAREALKGTDLPNVAIVLFFAIFCFWAFDYGLPLWSRIIITIYVATIVTVVIEPEPRKFWNRSLVITFIMITGYGLVFVSILPSMTNWTEPAIGIGAISIISGLLLLLRKHATMPR